MKDQHALAKYKGVASDSSGTVIPDKAPQMEMKKLGKPESNESNHDDWDDLVSDLEAY